MSKKGHTNNPNGRPPLPVRKVLDKSRMLGRVPDAEWLELKSAAAKSGKSFTEWALTILLKSARK
jgi:hypothetical protein